MTTQTYLKSEERRAATVEAVLDLSGQLNPSEITTALIAQQMGVTQGALFRHFPSKDAVWEATMEWVSRHLLGRIESVAAAADDPMDALEAMFFAHTAFVADHPGVPRILFGELQRQHDTGAKKAVRYLLARYGVVIETHVKRGQAMGVIRPDLDAGIVASLFLGTIQGLVMQAMLTPDAEILSRLAPPAFDLFRRAIGV